MLEQMYYIKKKFYNIVLLIMIKTKTEQEIFWAGNFGDNYSKRNSLEKILSSKIHFFKKVLSDLNDLNICLELGANIGSNLLAIKKIRPEIQLHGVEINQSAYQKLASLNLCESTHNKSLLEFKEINLADLVFTMGVLIHIGPNELDEAYDSIYNCTKRYILLCEYYSPSPTSVEYRGYSNKLFKRDFAGEMLDKYNDLKLVNYGFSYKRDLNHPLDDITWFLMEKKNFKPI